MTAGAAKRPSAGADQSVAEVYERGRRDGYAQAMTLVQTVVLAGGNLARLIDQRETA